MSKKKAKKLEWIDGYQSQVTITKTADNKVLYIEGSIIPTWIITV